LNEEIREAFKLNRGVYSGLEGNGYFKTIHLVELEDDTIGSFWGEVCYFLTFF